MKMRLLCLALLAGACSSPEGGDADDAPLERALDRASGSAWMALEGLDGTLHDLGKSFAAKRAVALPVSVKHRIGIDRGDFAVGRPPGRIAAR